MDKKNSKNIEKEETNMTLGGTIEFKNNAFNEFLEANAIKINLTVPKNPSINQNDEWRNEDFWDEKE